MITKRQAIRNVAAADMSLSNAAIKRAARDRYGLTIGANEITAVLGRYSDRRFMGNAGQSQLKLAANFLRQMGGDIRQAVRFLYLAQGSEAVEEKA